MLRKGLFKKPKNDLEGVSWDASGISVPDKTYFSCAGCRRMILTSDLEENLWICPRCGHYHKVPARTRLSWITDEGSFSELFADIEGIDALDFPGYRERLARERAKSGEREAVVCGTARVGGYACAVFVMEPFFLIGSMGTAVGEKITSLFEYAAKKRLPVLGYTVSGGARMQEGILSLMQMAKTSGAVKRHSDRGLLYVVVLTDPTTGGVTASFAMEADVILTEPGALICFAGPRVIEQTIRKKLPAGFQRAEFLLAKGFVDDIVQRDRQKAYLTTLLSLHCEGGPGCEGYRTGTGGALA